jgi:hypothetical protein
MVAPAGVPAGGRAVLAVLVVLVVTAAANSGPQVNGQWPVNGYHSGP